MRRRDFVEVTGLAAAAFSTACSARPRASLPTLAVGFAPYLSVSPLMVAQEFGHFEQAGIRVELHEFPASNRSVPLLAGGRLDVLLGAPYPGMFNAVFRGAAVRAVAAREVATTVCEGPFWIYGHRASFREDGDLIAQMKGMKVSAIRGGLGEFILAQWLQRAGLTLDDIEIIELEAAQSAAALATGRIQAMIGATLSRSNAALAHHIITLARSGDIVPGMQLSLVYCGKSLLEREDAVEIGGRFLAGYFGGLRGFLEGQTPRFMTDYVDRFEMDREAVIGACRDTMSLTGDINLDWLDRLSTWYQGRGVLDGPIRAEQMVDTRFLSRFKELAPPIDSSAPARKAL